MSSQRTNGHRRPVATVVKVVGDVAVLWLSFYLAFLIRFRGHLPESNFSAFVHVLPWFTVGFLLLASIYGLYERGLAPWSEVRYGLFLTIGLGLVAAMALSFFLRAFALPRSVLLLGSVVSLLGLNAWRRFVWRLQQSREGHRRVILVSSPEEVANLRRQLAGAVDGLAFEVVEVIAVVPPAAGMLREAASALTPERADAVLLTSAVGIELRSELALAALDRGLDVLLLPDLYELILMQAHMGQLSDGLLLSISGTEEIQRFHVFKRVMDIAFALCLLAVALPFGVLTALAVLLADGRPVLYSQTRLGRGGRPFRIYKFRTMTGGDAEAEQLPDDARITALGRILRPLRLDELPQLWNVLRGDMSLVGPRPELPHRHDAAVQEQPYFNHRLRVDPGLTGLAQILGRHDTRAAEKLKYDVVYARGYSPLLDLKILLRTVRAVLPGRGGRRAERLRHDADQ